MTAQDVMIYLMVVVSASDNRMADPELQRIGFIIRALPAFDGFDEDDLIPAAQACQKMLAGPNGLDSVLDLARTHLPKKLHDTAYALAFEIAAADRFERPEELRVLELLRGRLTIEPSTIEAIERAARIRHRPV
ncbi:MAG: tellurite resistance TerB family protein [Phyllobacteriaceae bacterium]|nr:tellurite resistance TerB family protein [Phyllobacteriaceae bacterium]